MIETIEIEVSDDDGVSWMLCSAIPTSPVLAYLNHEGSPWTDVDTGLVYRWRQ